MFDFPVSPVSPDLPSRVEGVGHVATEVTCDGLRTTDNGHVNLLR
jgi:hypothetical protein